MISARLPSEKLEKTVMMPKLNPFERLPSQVRSMTDVFDVPSSTFSLWYLSFSFLLLLERYSWSYVTSPLRPHGLDILKSISRVIAFLWLWTYHSKQACSTVGPGKIQSETSCLYFAGSTNLQILSFVRLILDFIVIYLRKLALSESVNSIPVLH